MIKKSIFMSFIFTILILHCTNYLAHANDDPLRFGTVYRELRYHSTEKATIQFELLYLKEVQLPKNYIY